jgi:predicted ATP-grasp superfamily ATP-dependent carboligase
MNVDLVIVGASIRAAAFSALRAGFQPAGADLFADQDLVASVPVLRVTQYPQQLSRALENWPGTDWLYTGALENHPRLVGQMEQQGQLLGNSQAVLERLARPLDLQKVLTGAGLSCPRIVLDRPDDRQGWLCKPVHSAGGTGIHPADKPIRPRPTGMVYYQQQVAGIPASAVFLATPTGVLLLGVTRQLVGPGFTAAAPFAYCGSIGPLSLSERLLPEVIAMGSVLGDHFSLRGLFGIDLVIDEQRAWFIEINPRISASAEIIERTTGQSLIGLHVDACRGASPRPRSESTTGQWGKAILFARQSLVVPAAFPSLFRTAEQDEGSWPSVADLPSAGSRIAGGRPVLTVFARGQSAGEVETRLRERIHRLEQQILPSTLPLATS